MFIQWVTGGTGTQHRVTERKRGRVGQSFEQVR